jgi:hypothetical protein
MLIAKHGRMEATLAVGRAHANEKSLTQSNEATKVQSKMGVCIGTSAARQTKKPNAKTQRKFFLAVQQPLA